MRRRLLFVALVTGLAALAAWSQGASAQAVERIQIADAARQQHGCRPGSSSSSGRLDDYNRLSVSEFGPLVRPALRGREQLGERGVRVARLVGELRRAAGRRGGRPRTSSTGTGSAISEAGSVPHVVGKRDVGTILGYYVMLKPAAASDARFEGAPRALPT